MPLPESLFLGSTFDAAPANTPRGAHSLDPLVRFTSLAEINSTFHAPLKPEIASLYARKAASQPRFLFTALLGRRFTYDRDLRPDAIATWKAGLFPLLRARRLGALILQFPWAFRFKSENRNHLIQLRRAFREFPLAAEFRHESWLTEEAIGTLIDYHISFVNLDQPAYFRALPPSAVLTSGVAVVRLLGRSSPETFRRFEPGPPPRPYLYNLDELEDWLPRLRRLTTHASRTLVITANTGPGRALVNALQIGEMLGAQPLLAPAPLLRRFPAELAAFRANRPVQATLLRDDLPSRAVA
jgi:uncharacterized protein YecE (DUF72 family)